MAQASVRHLVQTIQGYRDFARERRVGTKCPTQCHTESIGGSRGTYDVAALVALARILTWFLGHSGFNGRPTGSLLLSSDFTAVSADV